MQMLIAPMAAPDSSASPTPDGPPPSSETRETRITARTAIAMPARTSGGGTPWSTMPAATGIVAAITPVTGATHTHPPDRQPSIEGADPDDTSDPRRRAPSHVRLGRQRLPAEQREPEGERQAHELRDQ